MIKRPAVTAPSEPFIYDTSQLQRQAAAGPSAAGNKPRPSEQEPVHRPRSDTAPSLLMGLDLKGVEEEAELAIAKLKKTREQINIEGGIKIISQIDGPREALCVKYNEEFDYLAVGYSDGVIRVYKTSTGEIAFTLTDTDVQNIRAPCTSIKHRPVSKLYPLTNCYTATYANGCVKCWSYHFSQCIYTIKEKRQTFGLTYHPRFSKFVTYGDDRKIHFYDEETRTQERVLLPSDFNEQHDGHMSRIFAACFHPKNNYELITGGWDDVVQFWDLRQQYAIRHLSNLHICGEGLDINSRGTEVLTCSFQLTDPLQLFDYGSGKRIASLEPDVHPSKLYCGKYLSKDYIINGGADPHLLRIVDLQSTANVGLVNFLGGGVYGLDIGPQRKQKEKKDLYSEDIQIKLKSDLSGLPRVAFISAKKIYQIDFC